MFEITLSFETQEELEALVAALEAGEIEGATVVEIVDGEVTDEVTELVEEEAITGEQAGEAEAELAESEA